MNFVSGTPNQTRSESFAMAKAKDANRITEAQESVDLFRALLGPYALSTLPYIIRRQRDEGLTRAFASGNEKLDFGKPVDSEVKSAIVTDLAKLYPK